ncbi:hypothetical protein DSECCO2_626210 [anaerobic digester metagenome]
MTAEVAILNREAIALAADSAGTLRKESQDKIFTTVNKIFMLSKNHPIGVMVYGVGSFMGIPWETLIKMYREEYGQHKFNSLNGYSNCFINFLKNDLNDIITRKQEDRYFRQNVYSYLFLLSEYLKDQIKEKFQGDKFDLDEVRTFVNQCIDELSKLYENEERITTVDNQFKSKLLSTYRKVIDNTKRENFSEDLLQNKEIYNKLTEITISYFMKLPRIHDGFSGIVIAGFGEKEIFPSVESYLFDGMLFDKLLYREDTTHKRQINLETSASIVPFAQDDMILTFMTGINPQLGKSIKMDVKSVFEKCSKMLLSLDTIQKLDDSTKNKLKTEIQEKNDKIVNSYGKELEKYQQKHCINPVMEIVSNLPKPELALMAETFINLTSFKRKMSHDSETVAEPIDVAVISKGDGFVWIKRKHYFDRDLNHQFFENY